jgi:hypothetical protein
MTKLDACTLALVAIDNVTIRVRLKPMTGAPVTVDNVFDPRIPNLDAVM